MSDPSYMNLQEFWEAGYLQEVNRQFFHPRGLALEVHGHTHCSICDGALDRDDDGEWYHKSLATEMVLKKSHAPKAGRFEVTGLGGVWDYREDPEGITFVGLDRDKATERADQVAQELERHRPAREALYSGEVIQPLP